MSEISPLFNYGVKENHEMTLSNESELQMEFVKFLRNETNMLFTSFGDENFLSTAQNRLSSVKRGYKNGSPDLMIFEKCNKYIGICVELKSPNGKGKISPEQLEFLNEMKRRDYYILVSNDFGHIIKTITKYECGMLF
jgi:hypothetical protein